MNTRNYFRNKVRIEGILAFETAFHIGSGKEGELATNMGVLIAPDGMPILPGSTLKGNFRSLAERLSGYLGLSACLLDDGLSGDGCVTGLSDEKRNSKDKVFKELKTEDAKLGWLHKNTCDICRFFGSPLHASRIFFNDGVLINWSNALQIRDGVCIDRDSETARHGKKYDFEVVPAGAAYRITIELENPIDKELALVGAVLTEWEAGFRIGGFTSRGLGRVRLEDKTVRQVDYTDPDQLKQYLLKREMQEAETLLTESLKRMLNHQGGDHAEKNN
jgi:CRISPR-associated RAMP protein (TIGR02581 family)